MKYDTIQLNTSPANYPEGWESQWNYEMQSSNGEAPLAASATCQEGTGGHRKGLGSERVIVSNRMFKPNLSLVINGNGSDTES